MVIIRPHIEGKNRGKFNYLPCFSLLLEVEYIEFYWACALIEYFKYSISATLDSDIMITQLFKCLSAYLGKSVIAGPRLEAKAKDVTGVKCQDDDETDGLRSDTIRAPTMDSLVLK